MSRRSGWARFRTRSALRPLRREAELREEELAVLRREVGIGAAQADAGRFSSRSISDIVIPGVGPIHDYLPLAASQAVEKMG